MLQVPGPTSGGVVVLLWTRQTGLTVHVRGPALSEHTQVEPVITEEAAICASADDDLRVTMLVNEDQLVAQGAPILRLRHHPDIVQVAPMAGRIASIDLAPGRRLSEIRLFREDAAGRHQYTPQTAHKDDTALRKLLMQSGLWMAIRSRPFGRTPFPNEVPAAIFVVGLDTKPAAPKPGMAVKGRDSNVARGIAALLRLTPGAVFLCQGGAEDEGFAGVARHDRIKRVRAKPIHPWGLPGFFIHRHHPATLSRPVWDIQLEDVASIGDLLETGLVSETRLVSVAGPAATQTRLVRCQPGADLRGLSHGCVSPGAHVILSGSPLEGRPARWLGRRDRQVTIMGAARDNRQDHWLLSALDRASRPRPIIPTAAMEHALGCALPAVTLLRALAVGDRETAIRLGAMSFIPEDMSLADYVTCAEPRHSTLLHTLLQEIAKEEAG